MYELALGCDYFGILIGVFNLLEKQISWLYFSYTCLSNNFDGVNGNLTGKHLFYDDC